MNIAPIINRFVKRGSGDTFPNSLPKTSVDAPKNPARKKGIPKKIQFESMSTIRSH
jgi:hypothetical protein